ncbi:MAG: hypothetical protein AAF443_02470 [Chlamydiota bacterium]
MSASIVFVTSHAGPAGHFNDLKKTLPKKSNIEIYACKHAISKFDSKNVQQFNPEDSFEFLVEKCSAASVVITDVGDSFAYKLLGRLKSQSKTTLRCAYYDNTEQYVPGGYSATAKEVISVSDVILFANANLVNKPIYDGENQEIKFAQDQKKVGVGYSPQNLAKAVLKKRKNHKEESRSMFLTENQVLMPFKGLVIAYFGGNNSTYFEESFPALLEYLKKSSPQWE